MLSRRTLLMPIAAAVLGAATTATIYVSSRASAQAVATKPTGSAEDRATIKQIHELYKSLVQRYKSLSNDVTRLDNHVDNLAKFDPPVGTIMAYAGAWPTEPEKRQELEDKTGWMLCNGRVLQNDAYPLLRAAIGSIYTKGASETAFQLPDLRGVFLRGLDDSRKLDPGRSLGVYQGDTLQTHRHLDAGHSHVYSRTVGGGSYGDNSDNQADRQENTGVGYANLGGPVRVKDTDPIVRHGVETRQKTCR